MQFGIKKLLTRAKPAWLRQGVLPGKPEQIKFKMMKFKLIYPRWEKLEGQTVFNLPPHGPVVMAAAIPPDIEIDFTDENVENLVIDDSPDFVGISMMLTTQVKRGWEIADRYRESGKKVIFGGISTMFGSI